MVGWILGIGEKGEGEDWMRKVEKGREEYEIREAEGLGGAKRKRGGGNGGGGEGMGK